MDVVIAVLSSIWAVGTILAVWEKSFFPYEGTKELISTAGGWLIVGLCLAAPGVCRVSGDDIAFLTGLAAWWVVCAIRADRPDIAIASAGRLGLCLFAGLLAGSCAEAALIAALCAGSVDFAYCCGRLWLDWRFLGENKDNENCKGFQGNPNFFGLTHVLLFFVALHLGGWFLAFAAAELTAVALSKCRSAILGLAAGASWCAATGPYPPVVMLAVPAVTIVAFAIAFMRHGSKSAWLRLGLWSAVWPAIKENLVFGLGHNNLKLVMPWLIRQGREKGTTFPRDWNARKAHNDWIQATADAGVVGLAGWATFIAIAINAGPGTGLAAGVVAYAVAGLAMHPIYLPQVQVLLSLMIGALLANGGQPVELPAWSGLAWAIAGWVVVQPACRLWTFRCMMHRSVTEKFAGLGKAMRLEPKNTMGNLMMSHAALRSNRQLEAYIFANRAGQYFDGESMQHDVLKTQAAALAMAGATEIARSIFAEAAWFEGVKLEAAKHDTKPDKPEA